ncbi:MAG: alpha/beta hydrolase [Anaerolineales bacterium]
MPKIQTNGINTYYEIHGTGEPLVFIGGLGADIFLWFRQVPELSKQFQVITFDTRGAGESDKPEQPYTIRMFADDTAGLLNALKIEKASIVGASLGGLIAQQFTLAYPQMVTHLVLASTGFGGPHMVKPSLFDVIPALFTMRRSGDPAKDIQRSFELFTSKTWCQQHPDLVKQYVDWRVAHPQPPEAYNRQKAAVNTYNGEDLISQIKSPVLIVHGAKDRIVPVKNAHLLKAKLPQARLVIFPDAGHAAPIQFADEFNATVAQFLKE